MLFSFFFFFNDTATTEIYTLSLHDALPILFARRHVRPGSPGRRGASRRRLLRGGVGHHRADPPRAAAGGACQDRKSTRLNSSHGYISYAVFCLKKKKTSERLALCGVEARTS